MVPNDLCDATTRPIDERDCVLSDSRGCGTAWQVEEWGKVRERERDGGEREREGGEEDRVVCGRSVEGGQDGMRICCNNYR